MTCLHVENLGKAFRTYKSEWQRVARWFGIPVKPREEQWVLRNVNFRVQGGEAVGIVGQNGAGKSTLLKLVTGTLRPTEGHVQVQGRIAAILELGMGFNPELTGRQNAWHAAGLMGFQREQIEHIMPHMEEFAEIGDYFDQPVRTYSSGMQMRVAFAVVTAYRPEILIIDEALAVGDAYFQHKSFNRIRQFQKEGTTLLIVSHDRGAIQGLCDRAILLDRGSVLKDGDPQEVMDHYNALIAERDNSTVRITPLENGKNQVCSGTGEVRVASIALFNEKDQPLELVNVGASVRLQVEVAVHRDLPSLVLGYVIKDRLGQDIYGTNTWYTQQPVRDVTAGQRIRYHIHFPVNLGPGSYSVSTALVSTENHLVDNYEWKDLALVFNVVNLDKTVFVGSNWMEPRITVETS